ncbi:MAG TPA: CopD family protein [Novimethylophilus sp.]|jgi:putative membrane protein|uniref:CopD family protein n=1 Tax=Novimethylophilus sp. TaxID=2137426 RepID=UPI002F416030
MTAQLAAVYPWLKALHVTSVILWMGAQLLLPTLLAAHRGLLPSSAQAALLLRIECRLIRNVMNPAIGATFLFGALLAITIIAGMGHLPHWLALKFSLAFLLAALHGLLVRQFRHARHGCAQWTATAYRWAQGLNVVLLAGVVTLAVAKPSV